MSSPQPLLSQSSSADFWQKSHNSSSSPLSYRVGGGGGTAPSHGGAATNGELAAAYWTPSANPFYGGKGPPQPPGASSPSTKQRFPLQLPAHGAPNQQPSLPRARLREEAERRYAAPSNGVPNNSVGYKLANQRIGAPPMMMNVNEQRSPYSSNGHSQQQRPLQHMQQQPGVWTVEADRLARETRRPQNVQHHQQTKLQQMQQPPPPGAVVKYGDKSRGTPPRGGNGGRKPQRWGRFVQTLCCCIAPNRENAEKLPPINGSPTISDKPSKQQQPPPAPSQQHVQQGQQQQQQPAYSNGNGMPPAGLITQIQKPTSNGNAGLPSASPITQITQNGEGKTGLNGATAYQQAEITVSPGSYKPPPLEKLLLPPLQPRDATKKCLIIDLDETLVHSSFKPVKNPDFVIPVEIDGVVHQVYVLKRPYVDEFLARVGEKFECVLFTASLAKYADPVADLLDKRGVFRSRLFREACVFHKGNYIKDLARLGRDLNRTLIVDNSPTSYLFHPENAIPVQTWFDDPSDVELLDILPLLDRLAQVDSVYSVLRGTNSSPDSAALLDRPYP
ncbi:hypothetical protein PENTCL1PPCAC_6084 [Pristionchus entomophagus]|uniref:protein-serine/threonine phosphatase n=1 Tax=Pristionchus entomophagus TaxID=358040 RepID=A0AAV5SRG0_9BILA|nr:hypothetical protein PENTCL1PPCAC_6084 [Pristionchus entomophagus]